MSDVLTYKRGQVWMMRDAVINKFHTVGSVQRGNRPALIFSSDRGNETNNTVIVLKITSHSEKAVLPINVRYIDENGKPNVVLCNQIATIDKTDLLEYMYTVSDDVMSRVEKAHQIVTDTCATDIDNKIDEIYKLLEDLTVIKSNNLHDTTKDEKVIIDVASELQKLYANMSKYHDSTVEELKNSIPSINEHNAKTRMGLPYNIGEPMKSESSSPEVKNTDEPTKSIPNKEIVSKKKRKISENRKPHGYWTDERIKEFVSDKDKLSLDKWMKKYEYTDRKAIMKAYYTYSSKLNKVK